MVRHRILPIYLDSLFSLRSRSKVPFPNFRLLAVPFDFHLPYSAPSIECSIDLSPDLEKRGLTLSASNSKSDYKWCSSIFVVMNRCEGAAIGWDEE